MTLGFKNITKNDINKVIKLGSDLQLVPADNLTDTDTSITSGTISYGSTESAEQVGQQLNLVLPNPDASDISNLCTEVESCVSNINNFDANEVLGKDSSGNLTGLSISNIQLIYNESIDESRTFNTFSDSVSSLYSSGSFSIATRDNSTIMAGVYFEITPISPSSSTFGFKPIPVEVSLEIYGRDGLNPPVLLETIKHTGILHLLDAGRNYIQTLGTMTTSNIPSATIESYTSLEMRPVLQFPLGNIHSLGTGEGNVRLERVSFALWQFREIVN